MREGTSPLSEGAPWACAAGSMGAMSQPGPSSQPEPGVGKGRLTYGSYLRVPELLSLQQELSSPAHHDELLFIVSHQVYELWFKQMLHELRAIAEHLDGGRVTRASQLFERVHAVQALLTAQIPVLETMFSVEFARFRDRLRPASGFQSVQFRLLEFFSGRKNERMVTLVGDDDRAREQMLAALAGPTLYDHLMRCLARHGVAIPADVLGRDTRLAYAGDARVAEALAPVYRDSHGRFDLFRLCEHFVEYDERLAIWRFHHVQMVERMIGGMAGTGGSAGARYLSTTLWGKLFPDLWAVRDRLADAGAQAAAEGGTGAGGRSGG
ncbi:MAG: tryptophan 2,3-dioxygenase [Planctomyces sp.]|nr:tryptophan 2,3-dioxygenase [Planctomyces sp.]MBA4039980.1 tryptophan 2,3-dioxygenase [Planctomyces sp.]